MMSVVLFLAALAALGGAFPVARFSRWRGLSPWITVCVMTAAALLFASGAWGGQWWACALGVAVAVVQAAVGRMTARARRRVAQALAETEAGRG